MNPIRHSVPLLALTTALVLIALGTANCGSSTDSTQGMLGPAGGTLTLAGVLLDVPAGALTQQTAVTLRTSNVPGAMLVGIEPAQLMLTQKATLGVQLSGKVHVSGVTEVGGGPLGVDRRVENANGAQVQLRLDHFTQVRLALTEASDGGMSACCGDDCGEGEHGDGGHSDGEHGDGDKGDGGICDGGTGGSDHGDGGTGDGEHGDGEHRDGGHHDGEHGDGGMVASGGCPAGFECDDGVCVAPGGNDEENDDDCGEHGDDDGGMTASCPTGSHCSDGKCRPDETDAGMP